MPANREDRAARLTRGRGDALVLVPTQGKRIAALVLLSSLPDLGFAADSDEIETITVHGRRDGQARLAATPVETEILPSAFIRESPANDLGALLRNQPGLRVQRRIQGEAAAVSIEGMPPSYTAVRVDGQRYAGEIGGVDDLREFPLASVEQVEIRRGPQALRFGPEAGGGVINLVTKSPPAGGFEAQASGGGGDDHNALAQGVWGVGSPSGGGSLAFEYNQIGGFEPPSDTGSAVLIPFGAGSRRRASDAYAKGAWSPQPEVTVGSRLGWRQRRESFELQQEDGRLATLERQNERWLAGSGVEWEIDPETRITSDLSYFWSQTRSEVGRQFTLNDDEVKGELLVERRFSLGAVESTITLGGDLRHQTLDLRDGVTDVTIGGVPLGGGRIREAVDQGGFFVIGDGDVNGVAQVEFGVRVQFHTLYSPKLLPQAAVMLDLMSWEDGLVRLRLSAGRNHRVPSLRELNQPPVPQIGGAYFLAGNPELRAESSTSYRASVELESGGWGAFSVVGFYNEIEDHIRSAFNGNSVTISSNIIPADPFLCGLDPLGAA